MFALTSHPTFEGFQTYVAGVGPALLVLAGFVADESALLSEAMFAHVAGVGTLAGVSPVVFVQTRWFPVGEFSQRSVSHIPHRQTYSRCV